MIEHQDEIEALRLFQTAGASFRSNIQNDQSTARQNQLDRPNLMPLAVWDAYRKLDKVKSERLVSELTALVSLLRAVCELDAEPIAFEDTVRRNFQTWVMSYHSGGSVKSPKNKWNGCR